MPTIMIRVEPSERINRRYSVSVQGTLFDPLAVVCTWGNRRTGYHRRRVLQADAPESATELAAAIVAQKTRRGYLAAGAQGRLINTEAATSPPARVTR